jgi:hypothetical protein
MCGRCRNPCGFADGRSRRYARGIGESARLAHARAAWTWHDDQVLVRARWAAWQGRASAARHLGQLALPSRLRHPHKRPRVSELCDNRVGNTRPTRVPITFVDGYGTATGALEVGHEIVDEEALTAVFMAPFNNGEIALLFYLEGYSPLLVERIFNGRLRPARAPFGGALTITVPL